MSPSAGNHETDNMNQMYGFEGEVKAKYTAQMFQLFSEVFQWLPLAQCINGKVLVSGSPATATAVATVAPAPIHRQKYGPGARYITH